GVEAYVEPPTPDTGATLLLIATTGEWTRRRVPDERTAFDVAGSLGVPVYNVRFTGYPQRMRARTSPHGRRSGPPPRRAEQAVRVRPGDRTRQDRLLAAGSALRAALDEAEERAHGDARPADRGVPVGRALVERGARDVQVRPGRLADELPEEQAGDEHPAEPVADVGEVRDLRLQRRAELLGQRHRPELLARGLGRRDDLRAHVVGAHDRGDAVAERDHLGAGERR